MNEKNLRPWLRPALLAILCLVLLCVIIAVTLAIWVNTYSQAPQVIWTTIYNEYPDYALTGGNPYVGVPYALKLNALELRHVTPDGKADWMRYKDGFAIYDDEAMRFVAFKVTTQTPGVDVHISVGQWAYYAEAAYLHRKDYTASVLGDVSYTLCQNSYYLSAFAQVNGIYYTFQVERIPEQDAVIKADLKTVLECFTTYEPGVPTLQRIHPNGKPVYFAYWEYTAQQARKDDTFGEYFPNEDPEGFVKFSGMRINGLLMRNQMSGLWSGEEGERLRWAVVQEYVQKWNGPELMAYIDDDTPLLEGRSFSKEDLEALLKDDATEQSLAVAIRYGNVFVRVEWDSLTQGVDVDWLYEQLKSILWRR